MDDLDSLRKAVTSSPNDMGLRLALGERLLEAGLHVEAVDHLQAAKAGPAVGRAGYLLARCYLRARVFNMAIRELEKAREQSEPDLRREITYLLGRIFERAGANARAVAEYERIAKDPGAS